MTARLERYPKGYVPLWPLSATADSAMSRIKSTYIHKPFQSSRSIRFERNSGQSGLSQALLATWKMGAQRAEKHQTVGQTDREPVVAL